MADFHKRRAVKGGLPDGRKPVYSAASTEMRLVAYREEECQPEEPDLERMSDDELNVAIDQCLERRGMDLTDLAAGLADYRAKRGAQGHSLPDAAPVLAVAWRGWPDENVGRSRPMRSKKVDSAELPRRGRHSP